MTLHKISQGKDFAVHNYFHICPESLDGRKVAYSLYPDGPHPERVGPCQVMVCNRDGSNQKQVGFSRAANHHQGAKPLWLDEQRLVYENVDQVHIINVYTGEEVIYPGGVDNYSPLLGKIYYPDNHDPEHKAICRLDVNSGLVERLVEMDELARFSPLGGVDYSNQTWMLAHAYIAPDASKLAFAVFNGSPLEAFIFLAEPDGTNLTLFGPKPMHWTFYDPNSFFGHDDKRDHKDKFLRRWDLAGNILETLAGYGCHATLSPNRQWIVTESWYGSDPVEIYLYRRGETTPTQTLAVMSGSWHYRAHVHPAFSRDGNRVYFNYNAPGSKGSQVYSYNLEDT